MIATSNDQNWCSGVSCSKTFHLCLQSRNDQIIFFIMPLGLFLRWIFTCFFSTQITKGFFHMIISGGYSLVIKPWEIRLKFLFLQLVPISSFKLLQKHIEVSCHFIRERWQKEIQMVHTHSKDQMVYFSQKQLLKNN